MTRLMRECIDKLPNLSRQELTSLSLSKWAKDVSPFMAILLDFELFE